MRASLRIGLSTAIALASVSASVGEAHAQPKPAPGPPGQDRSNSQFTLRREEAGGGAGQTARARARAGDCAGALPEFDEAVRTSIDPNLRRDRGICHDKLGDVYPAIDDFRAYLTARPDAPDAEAIRQRLNTLEAQTGQTRAGSAPPAGENPEEASASVTVGSKGVYASTSESGSGSASGQSEVIGPKPGEKAKPFDYYVEQEHIRDAAQKSPLRYGSGVVLGPYLTLPRFYTKLLTEDFGYGAGLAVRYSTGRTLTLVSEIGFAGFGKTGEATSRSGPELMGGIELRLPVSRLAADHILLRGGVGYERNVVSGTRATLDELLGRFGLGFRHTFGTSVALEALADGGPAVLFPEGSSSTVVGFVGLSVALVVGF
jgi:hypothetical protein